MTLVSSIRLACTWRWLTAVICLGVASGGWQQAAIAQNPLVQERSIQAQIDQFLRNEPVDLSLLQPDNVPMDGSIVTQHTLSQTEMTIPSLWWAEGQFGRKLLSGWIAYTGVDGRSPRVDLVVNQPVWNAINYLQRYTFVNQFGTESQAYGYNVRVFNRQQEPLAAYVCEATFLDLSGRACHIGLTSGGRGAIEGGSNNPFTNR